MVDDSIMFICRLQHWWRSRRRVKKEGERIACSHTLASKLRVYARTSSTDVRAHTDGGLLKDVGFLSEKK
jgi:hypothetical protein